MSIFKVRDKVYHIEYGWGVVIENDNGISFPILVEFASDLICSFTLDGRESTESKSSTLSFTEYTLQGFSQERPVELPEVGELCLVRDKDHHSWIVKGFVAYIPNASFPYITEYEVAYAQMKRIKILD
jgi:hypothetical protein